MFLFLLIEVISKIGSAGYHFEIHVTKRLPDSLEEKQVDMFVTSWGSLIEVYLKLIIVSIFKPSLLHSWLYFNFSI